jgi:HSP20 family protein
MPARNANRGRGGGQGREGNRPSGAGSRQGSSGAASASSQGGSNRGGGRDTPGGGSSRTGNRATSSTAQSSGAARRSGPGRATGSGTARGSVSQSVSTQEPTLGKGGFSSGIAGGDLVSGGISSMGQSASTTSGRPRPADVDAGLFGSRSPATGAGGSDRERQIDQQRESRDTSRQRGQTDIGAEPGTRVAGRPRSPGLSAWLAGAENPLAMMRRIQDDLDRVFRTFGVPRLSTAFTPPRELEELLATSPTLAQSAQWSPQIEVFERDGNLVVHADLPAVRREDVQVEIDNDVLTIRGERRHQSREAEGGYRRTERSYGTFLRQIPLPEGVDPSGIEASYQDGVLEVIVPTPRDEQRPRRRIEIR